MAAARHLRQVLFFVFVGKKLKLTDMLPFISERREGKRQAPASVAAPAFTQRQPIRAALVYIPRMIMPAENEKMITVNGKNYKICR